MKKLVYFLISLVLLNVLILLSSCNFFSQKPSNSDPVSNSYNESVESVKDEQSLKNFFEEQKNIDYSVNSDEIEGYELNDFLIDLETEGYKTTPNEGEGYFIQTLCKVITIDSEDVEIYQFKTNDEMEKTSANISADGTTSEVCSIDWKSLPHFYKKDTIIVQYIGESDKTTALLEKILGSQFAGSDE